MAPHSLPAHVDHRQLSSHLQDHLTAASAGRARAHDMADRHADTELGPRLARFAGELDDEHARLTDLVDELGVQQPLAQQAVARVGEVAIARGAARRGSGGGLPAGVSRSRVHHSSP